MPSYAKPCEICACPGWRWPDRCIWWLSQAGTQDILWLESAATPRALRATAIQTKQCHRRYRSAFFLQSPSTESICELFHIIPAFIRCLVIVSIVLSKVLLNYCSIEILEGLNMFRLPTFKPQNPHLVNEIFNPPGFGTFGTCQPQVLCHRWHWDPWGDQVIQRVAAAMRIGIGFTEAGGVMLPSLMVSKADIF